MIKEITIKEIKEYGYENRIENLNNLKRLNEIIYNTYNNYNNNYYNAINIENILINYKNKEINNELNEVYENVIKIKQKSIINEYEDKIKNIKLEYENKDTESNKIINYYLKEISEIKENNIKISEEIKKLKYSEVNENTIKNISDINNNIINKNIIRGSLVVKLNENNNITLFNTNIKYGIDVYLDSKIINMKQDNESWIIDYKFEKDGIYEFKIIFNCIYSDLIGFFEECSNITSLDFSYFNTSNITDMSFMFNKCKNLKEIKGINKINTNKVIDMQAMFQHCEEL